MPLLADAIVECGRRTLTNAIELANQWGRNENGRWYGAHVVYGDTDSLFIKLPNRSVKEAFAFGESFCKAVTASNPPPIQLKLEKVYVASLLQTVRLSFKAFIYLFTIAFTSCYNYLDSSYTPSVPLSMNSLVAFINLPDRKRNTAV